MTIIFAVPFMVWRLGRSDYWAPLVVAQIIAGFLLGPGVLGPPVVAPKLRAPHTARDSTSGRRHRRAILA